VLHPEPTHILCVIDWKNLAHSPARLRRERPSDGDGLDVPLDGVGRDRRAVCMHQNGARPVIRPVAGQALGDIVGPRHRLDRCHGDHSRFGHIEQRDSSGELAQLPLT
jgi:hypothetical protein